MQKIFYGGHVLTFNEMKSEEAFLVNDGSIVLTGKNDEVLQMKTDQTELVDLKGKTVCPSFFYVAGSVFKEIEKRLKNTNKADLIEKISENNENYDKFCNFDIYLEEFLNIQAELISAGVLTVQETQINEISFSFFKKLADQKLIKINIIGYVDILTSKDVMDNNCRSYRKYQNGFRLAGFSLELDGNVASRTAWLNSSYVHPSHFLGMGNLFDEQLNFVVKTALEEKRQLVVFANGDRAIAQLFRCFENNFKDNLDTMRPLLVGAEMFSKRHLKDAEKFKFSLCVKNEKESQKLAKRNLGFLRFRKFNDLKMVVSNNLKIAVGNGEFVDSVLTDVDKMSINLSKKTMFDALQAATLNSAFVCFEDINLGSIENGKKANFVVLSGNPYQMAEVKVLHTFFEGNEIK